MSSKQSLGMRPYSAGLRAIAALMAIAVSSIFGIPAARATAGAEIWVASHNAPGDSLDYVSGLQVSPDGSRVFVTGFTYASTGDDYLTVAFDASSGVELWAKRYNGAADAMDQAMALGVTPDGSKVFVTGWSHGATTSTDFATVAYDAATGARLWSRRYSSPLGFSADRASALGVSPDGSAVFVTGTIDGGPDLTDYGTVAYDPSTGHTLWTARYAGPYWDSARVLSVSPDGTAVFVSGFSAIDCLTVSYDASTGDRLWKTRYDGPTSHEDQANAMTVSPDGSRVFVTGFSEASNRKRDFVTIAYSASTGAQRWVRRYNGPGDFNDNGKAIGVGPDGSRVFVTGYRTGHGGRDVETIAHDASTGTRSWLRSYNGPADSDDQGTALGVSPDGKTVFVTGFRDRYTTNRGFETVAYRTSTGAPRWLSFYGSGSASVADALGVSPDGSSVFVSGSFGATTVAYSTT